MMSFNISVVSSNRLTLEFKVLVAMVPRTFRQNSDARSSSKFTDTLGDNKRLRKVLLFGDTRFWRQYHKPPE